MDSKHSVLIRSLKVTLDRDLRTKLYPDPKKLKEFFLVLDMALSLRFTTLEEIGTSRDEMKYYKKKLFPNTPAQARVSKR